MDTTKANGCTCCSQPTPSCCPGTADAGTLQGIMETDSTISFANRIDHLVARWGVNRMGHIVPPGLYRLGNPAPESPVFASANYTLSFDALRSALAGIDAWILVLDTKGINVWCAAGKGTFGTDELVHRIEATGLSGIVAHRKIIVPQLGAPGIAWPEVARRAKFIVEFGPVRARDLPEYLKTHTATPAMRRVEFPFRDRIVLSPVELIHAAIPAIIGAVVLYLLAGLVAALAAITAVVGGTVLFPALLPFIPTKDFSTKGLILGLVLAIPFAISFGTTPVLPFPGNALGALAALLLIPAVVAYLALNFTGCTTFTSRTGVKKEIFRYVPVMAAMAVVGSLAGIAIGVGRLLGMM